MRISFTQITGLEYQKREYRTHRDFSNDHYIKYPNDRVIEVCVTYAGKEKKVFIMSVYNLISIDYNA